MSDENTKTIYHNCYTRNHGGARIEIEWVKGEKCTYGGTNNQFWDRKIYNMRVRNRKFKNDARKRIMNNRKKSPVKIPL